MSTMRIKYAEFLTHLNVCVFALHVGRSTDEHIDKTIVNDLVSDENAVLAKQEAKIDKKNRIAEQKLRERLKAERKKSEGRGSKMDKDPADDDDEGEMITQFAKGSRKNR